MWRGESIFRHILVTFTEGIYEFAHYSNLRSLDYLNVNGMLIFFFYTFVTNMCQLGKIAQDEAFISSFT